MHSLLDLPINAKKRADLSGDALDRVRDALEGVHGLIVDEKSMVGQKMLYWIDARLKQVGNELLPFGGFSIILVGDFASLS